MFRIGNLRVGKGICLIQPKKFRAVGTGTKSFIEAVAAEQGGVDTNRPHRLPFDPVKNWQSLYDELED